jgi:hypothetical protein
VSSREGEGGCGFWGDATLAGIVKTLLALITTVVLIGVAYFAVAVLVSVIWYCGDRFLLSRARSCPERKIGPGGEVFEDFSDVNRADFVGVLTWMGYVVYAICGIFIVGLVVLAIAQMKWW